LDKVKQALENSLCYISVWHVHEQKQQLIGFARAIGDGVFQAVLLDILVHPDFQNQGLGKRIVRALTERLQQLEIKEITLFASPHIVDFYHKLGFVCSPNNLQWMIWCGD
jgi:ribosomal protein S18 acetylase RimI-like enzyme